MVKERERQHRSGRQRRDSETSEMLQLSGCYRGADQERTDSVPESEESEDDEVLGSEGGELEEVDESAFGKSMASAVEQQRCVWVWACLLKCLVPELA